MNKTIVKSVALASAVVLATGMAHAQEYKVGIVTFLSGAASGPFGIPAKNAADLIIDALNSGTLPGPFAGTGMDGRNIVPIYVDEAGGATKQIAEFRNLSERDRVDSVVGYISSGNCLAIPSVAEELETLTVLFDCGTPRVFEEASYKYVFRTQSTATMDNVAAAYYVNELLPDLKSVSGINQNYAWGHDSWRDFIATLNVIKGEDVDIKTEQFPKIFAGQYGAEISALMVKRADIVHSSFWGGDAEAFILQSAARGLLEDNLVLLTTGETTVANLAEHLTDGMIIGARGPFGFYAPESELNDWFVSEYTKRFGSAPTFPAYHMAHALIGLKLATDKAGVGASDEEVIKAFEYLEFEGPGGLVQMNRGKGHQGATETVYGQVKNVDGEITFVNIRRYAADCVTPPDGTVAIDWINAGMPGAVCD